jgi:hypothetical protein
VFSFYHTELLLITASEALSTIIIPILLSLYRIFPLFQADVYPEEWLPMRSVKAKFIASTKVQTEQIISNSHPYLKLEA